MKLTSNEAQMIVDALRDAADLAKGNGNEDAHNGRVASAVQQWAAAHTLETLALRIVRAKGVDVT